MKNTSSKPITKILFLLAFIFALLMPSGKAQAQEYFITDAGYLSKNGNTELRETEITGEVDYYLLKFKAKKDGYVIFTAKTPVDKDYSGAFHGFWRLCDSSRQSLTQSDMFRMEESVTFAIKKNKTYYLKVDFNDAVVINHQYKAVTDKSGSKKSKAYSLKKNKTASGLLISGENKTDWYKIKLTKKQALKLTFTTKSNNGLCVEVFSSKNLNKAIEGLAYKQTDSRNETVSLTSRNGHYSDSPKKKLEKGTYYVKVYGMKGWQQSGFYSLKWK
ncbi:MAG: hypothetical protein NC307_03755 [Roseburia sp.]|nr:hypothetical protein [Roseburia sp.]